MLPRHGRVGLGLIITICLLAILPCRARPCPPSPPACSGGWGLPSAFPDLPLPQREAVLQAWSGSTDVRMRKVRSRGGHLATVMYCHRSCPAVPACVLAVRPVTFAACLL
jgi:hypothetical protein